ncbi:shootin-1 [Polyodon spathula]|uniref:shootin-1 n=1 Tax=Polyodon spathula TaxID=7913 RepID=UPI001B7D9DBA|nr:shootin-1 [Polyodon spathula]
MLKRMSQALMPMITELPEHLEEMTLKAQASSDPATESIQQYQKQIKDLQDTIDKLLNEKMQLSSQVKELQVKIFKLTDELTAERQERESLVKSLHHNNKTMKRLSRVSQLVSQEYNEVSMKLELEQDLRQHAEVFAHRMLVRQKEASRQSMILLQSAEPSQQLLEALNKGAELNKTLEELKLQHEIRVKELQAQLEESALQKELSRVKVALDLSVEDKQEAETQLSQAQLTIIQLQEEVKQMKDALKLAESHSASGMNQSEKNTPAPLEELMNRRRKGQANPRATTTQPTLLDVKSKAVNEMMERIKNGIILKPTQRNTQDVAVDDSSNSDWNTKNSMKKPVKRRSCRRISRRIPDQELIAILQRRRRAMEDGPVSSETKPLATRQGENQPENTAPSDSKVLSWGAGTSNAPVLRRLRQTRANRDSRIRASESTAWWNS